MKRLKGPKPSHLKIIQAGAEIRTDLVSFAGRQQ
jgi:hypothetical protein